MNVIVLIGTIIIICKIVKKTKQRNQERRKYNRTGIKQLVTIGPEPEQKEVDKIIRSLVTQEKRIENNLIKQDTKQKQNELKQADKKRKIKFQAIQAHNDILHYEQQKKELLQVYDYYMRIEKDVDKPLKTRQAALLKEIAINDKLRIIERKIEKATYNMITYNKAKSGPEL